MKKRAFGVGVNTFTYEPSAALRGCRNDCLDMRGLLMLEMGIPEDQITYLLDGKAEAQRVIDTLAALAETTDEGDYLAFTFSSHGTQMLDPSGVELDGYMEALVCADIKGDGENWTQGFITDKVFRDILKLAHPGARVECWLDTCFAGGVKELMALGMTHSKAKMMRPLERDLPTKRLGLAPPDNVVIWAACKESQTSADTFIGDKWCGAFTYFFRHAFRPELSRADILKRVRSNLSVNDYSQVPVITYGNDEMAAWTVGE